MKIINNIATLLMCLTFTTLSAQHVDIDRYDELNKKNSEASENIDTVATIWKGNYFLGFNQGLLHNWSAGGELLSASLNTMFNGAFIKYNGPHIWTNTLDLGYGLFYAYSNQFIPRKVDDRIDFTSRYSYKIWKDKDFFLAGLLNAKTQFTKAYDYTLEDWKEKPISDFLSPLYVTVAPGLEYRKGSELSIFFSPLAFRYTHVSKKYTERYPEGAFGVQNGKESRIELGAYLTTRYNKDFTENLTYRGRFDVYSNYLAKDTYKDGILVKKDNPGNLDFLIDNQISYKFLKYFAINLGVLAIYDNDVPYNKYDTDPNTGALIKKDDPTMGLGWWQVKQILSLGFNYKF